MRKPAAVYIFFCILAGLGSLVFLTIHDYDVFRTILPGVIFFSVLGVVAESQSLAIDEHKAISIAFAIDICALLLFGLAGAAWVSFWYGILLRYGF